MCVILKLLITSIRENDNIRSLDEGFLQKYSCANFALVWCFNFMNKSEKNCSLVQIILSRNVHNFKILGEMQN